MGMEALGWAALVMVEEALGWVVVATVVEALGWAALVMVEEALGWVVVATVVEALGWVALVMVEEALGWVVVATVVEMVLVVLGWAAGAPAKVAAEAPKARLVHQAVVVMVAAAVLSLAAAGSTLQRGAKVASFQQYGTLTSVDAAAVIIPAAT